MKKMFAAITAAGLLFAGSALAAEDQAPDAAAAPDQAADQVQDQGAPSASEQAPADESGAINQDESKDSGSKY